MNQIIKIIERKITEISKKSQAGREEYDEEQEKLLKSLFFDDGEIKKYLAAKKAKKSAATEALKTENEALKSEIGKINKENQELFDSNKKLDKNVRDFETERKEWHEKTTESRDQRGRRDRPTIFFFSNCGTEGSWFFKKVRFK